MNDADQALYASKDKGRAQHTVFEPPSRQIERRSSGESDRRKTANS